MTSANIPSFWLKLKPEYIDGNAEAFLSYLSGTTQNQIYDPTAYKESVALLSERCSQLADALHGTASIPDAATLRLAARLFGALTLIHQNKDDRPSAVRWFALTAEALAALYPKRADVLAEKAVLAMTSNEIDATGFAWRDIVDGNATGIMAEKIRLAEFIGECPEAWYQTNGCIHVHDGLVDIWSCNRDAVRRTVSAKPSFTACGGKVRVMTSSADAIRKGETTDPDKSARFLNEFLRAALESEPSPDELKKDYHPGDTMPVRYLSTDRNGNLVVMTVDTAYNTVKGIIRRDMPVTKTYTTADLETYLRKGSVFDATWEGPQNGRFNVLKTIPEFITNQRVKTGLVEAICKDCKGNGYTIWFTEKGYPVSTKGTKGYVTGDHVVLDIESWDEKNIRCSVYCRSEKRFSEDAARRAFLEAFAYPPGETFDNIRKENNITDAMPFAAIGRLLTACDAVIDVPSERIAALTCAGLLHTVTGDESGRTASSLKYLRVQNLILFVQGKTQKMTPPGGEFSAVPSFDAALAEYRILSCYGTDTTPELDLQTEDPATARLMELDAAERSVRNILPKAMLRILRTKVMETVGICAEDTDSAGLESTNIGPESGTQEQKVSFLEAPREAKEQNQERTVFRVIDAFLNSETGGTLYIGVRDDGFVNGLDQDFKLMERLYPDKKGMDGYLRLLRMRLQTAFPQEVYTTLTLTPVFGGRAVAIRVPPYPYGVVELYGTAWVRFGPECLRMSDRLKERTDRERKEQTRQPS